MLFLITRKFNYKKNNYIVMKKLSQLSLVTPLLQNVAADIFSCQQINEIRRVSERRLFFLARTCTPLQSSQPMRWL